MTGPYQKLFGIECRHGYFTDGLCHALELRPTAECRRLLDRYACLFRPSEAGGIVYYSSPDLLRLFDETTPFAFGLNTSGSRFTDCTEPDSAKAATPGASIYYFSNLLDYPENSGAASGTLPLHPPGEVFANGTIPVRTAHRFPNTASATVAKVSDMLGNEIRPGQKITDLSGVADGRYRAKTDGGGEYDFYLTNEDFPQRWGVAEIFAGGPRMGAVPPVRRVLDARAAPVAPLLFTISFEARKSFWRYYIVSQSTADRTYGDYRIAGGPPKASRVLPGNLNGTGAVTFRQPAPEKLDGKDAWVFESNDAIPLYEHPGDHHEFTLGRIGRNAGGVPLPYARAEATRLEEVSKGGRRAVSEIYVYL